MIRKKLKTSLLKFIPSDSQKIFYILTQIVISTIGFIKSFVFLKYLGFYDLGLITIIQTIVSFINMFQLGLLSGGYRIFSLDIKKDNFKINNLIFSYVGILFFASTCILVLLYVFAIDLSYGILFIALITGIFSLCSRWFATMSVAVVRLKELNTINIIASSCSLLILCSVPYWGFYGAVLTLLSRPLIFTSLNFYRHVDFRPTSFTFDFKLVNWILTFGFIPFLVGILSQFNVQIQRWSITYWLGTETLGKFYLPIVYSTVFALIPGAIYDLYFPPLMKSFHAGNFIQFQRTLKKYFFILLGYVFISLPVTYFLSETVVLLLFPKHYEFIKYIYAIMPGLIALTLAGPIRIIFNASIKLKPMLWAYLTSVVLTISLILILRYSNNLSLLNIAIVKSIVGIYICLFFYVSYHLIKDKIWMIKTKDRSVTVDINAKLISANT